MGGRGTYAIGNNVPYTYTAVDWIDGVKLLLPNDNKKSLKLPEESHSSFNYIIVDKNNIFRQYREYNENHQVVLEIGYHNEPSLGEGKVLHIHIYNPPGVENHNSPSTIKRLLTEEEKKKYKKLFIGVENL